MSVSTTSVIICHSTFLSLLPSMESFFQIHFVTFRKIKMTPKTRYWNILCPGHIQQSAEVKNLIVQIMAKWTNLERKLILVFLQLTEGLYFATFYKSKSYYFLSVSVKVWWPKCTSKPLFLKTGFYSVDFFFIVPIYIFLIYKVFCWTANHTMTVDLLFFYLNNIKKLLHKKWNFFVAAVNRW